MGIIKMIEQHQYTFIIFPIAILVGCIFKYFDDSDRNYLMAKGIDPDEYSILGTELSYGLNNSTSPNRYNTNNRYTPYNGGSSYTPKPNYKEAVKKCKRSVIIKVENDKK
jgi:hypothetical protein